MKKNHPYERFHIKVKPALKCKVEEFIVLGLKEVTEDDIWQYLTMKKWKKPNQEIHLYEIVADIISLSSNQFMTFRMVEAYKAPNLFDPLSKEELNELLN